MKIVLTLFLLPTVVLADETQQSLKWGADPSGGAPYVYLDPTDFSRYIGFETEFMEVLSEKMGYKPELVPYAWDTLVPALQRGEYDMIVNGFEAAADRPDHVLMSDPYYLFQLQVTVRKENNSIQSLADCKGCIVGALANSAAVRILKSQNIIVKEYADPASPYQDLMTGRIDAVLADLPITMAYAAPNPHLKPAGPPQYRGAYVIGVRKGNEALLAKANHAIKSLIQEGKLQQILTKWQLWDDLQPELAKGSSAILSGDIPTNSFDWRGAILRLSIGAGITALIGVGSMIIALLLGVPLAIILLRAPPWGRFLIGIFVEFFRGTPILVQLFFLYFGLPAIGITIPGWVTALVGLGLNYAAYESQVFRNAFESIPKGQWEAAVCLGMSPFQIFKKIIFPQGLRFALPPMTNDFVSLFKDTSVVFAISVWELATAYRELANSSQQYFLLSLVTCIYYLALSVPLSRYARHLERSLKRQNKKKSPQLVLAESSS